MAALMLAGCGKGEGISILPERGSSTNTARAASDPGESAEALSVADGFGSGVKSPAGSEEASAEPEDTEDVVDRLLRGRVVDFLDFHWREAYHYPTFNLADVAICAGVGLLLLHTLRCSRRKR